MFDKQRKKEEAIIELIIQVLYDERFPMENYITAEYITGRKERAIEYYKANGTFHYKVDLIGATILNL